MDNLLQHYSVLSETLGPEATEHAKEDIAKDFSESSLRWIEGFFATDTDKYQVDLSIAQANLLSRYLRAFISYVQYRASLEEGSSTEEESQEQASEEPEEEEQEEVEEQEDVHIGYSEDE